MRSIQNWTARGLAMVFCLAAVHPLQAAEKDQFNLFNPTPRELMRPLSTDRPDKTESPYTVDAGHFQIESDLVSYARERDSDSLALFVANLRVGLLNNFEVQFIAESFRWERIDEGGIDERSGYGDTFVRAKLNLWGNDSGKTALALLPFFKLPTSADDLGSDDVEFGFLVPLAIDIADGWGLGLMSGLSWIEGEDNPAELINSITVAREVTDRIGVFLEFFSSVDPDNTDDWVGTIDVGFTYAINEDVQLDGGINFGVTDDADDFNPFIGLTVRF